MRIGQFGPFLARKSDGERITASLPADLPPADLSEEMVEQLLSQKKDGPEALGVDPETEKPIYLKIGPYGPYVQLGDEGKRKNGKKAQTHEPAQGHGAGGCGPGTGAAAARIAAHVGRTSRDWTKSLRQQWVAIGPYVSHDGVFASIKAPDDVLEIELARALELLAQKKKGSKKSVLKELGEHPDGGASRGAGRPLWSLRQVQAHQRHVAQRCRADLGHHGDGATTD